MMHLSETVRGNGGSHRGYPRLVLSQTRQLRFSRLRQKGQWTHLGSLCPLEAEFVDGVDLRLKVYDAERGSRVQVCFAGSKIRT
jgi:hypothetical protein